MKLKPYPAYKDTRDAEARAGAATFSGLAAFTIRRINLRTAAAAEGRTAEPLWGILASANYFDVLGVRPILGRGFLAGESNRPDRVERHSRRNFNLPGILKSSRSGGSHHNQTRRR